MNTQNLLKKKISSRSDSLQVLHCLNLRPTVGSDGSVLTAVGAPSIIADKKWLPLAKIDDSLLVYNGNTLACLGNGTVTQIASLPSAPLCVHVRQQYLTVMTDKGAYYVRRNDDGSFSDIGLMPQLDAIAVTAEYNSTFESTVSSCSTSAITAAVTAAYREIVDSARLAGALVQPVLARCRLLDAAGNVVFVTPPVAVMLPDGAPLVSAWQFGSDDGGETVLAQTFSAAAYKLRVSIGANISAAWQKIIQTLELQVSPQFHPIDFSGTAQVSLGRASSTDKYVRVTLPGVERGLSATRAIASTQLIKRAIERFDSIAQTVAYINNPFGSVTDHVVDVAMPMSVSDEADKMAAALATSAPAKISTYLSRLLIPHSFIAQTVASAADAVVWANITPIRFGGYGALAYAAAVEEKSYTGFVAVTFASGERVVTNVSGNFAPTALSPLIIYPSAEAVAIDMAISVDGESDMRTFSAALTADVTGRYAYYVSPTLKPVAMTQTAAITAPTAVSANLAMPGYVAVSANTTVPAAAALGYVGSNVITILPARSGSSAWEYKRARFYAFDSDGIKLLTVNSALSECAVNLLTSGAIANAHCVADGGNSVYALCADRLLQLSANSVKVIANNVVGDRIARIAADNEVIVANTDDNEATHYCLDLDAASYNTSLVIGEGWLATDGTAYAESENGLANLGVRTIAAETSVRWQASCVVGRSGKRLPCGVRWMLKASAFNGTLSIDRMWLSTVAPTPKTIARLTVSGAVKSPILCRLNGHRSVDLQLVMQATVSKDFCFTTPQIVF